MKDALRQYFRGWVDHPHLGRRIAIAVVSTVMMGLCVLAFERLDVGTDPFSCACIGLSNLLGIDLGHVEAVVHTVTLLIVLAVAKDMFGFGSLANMFLVGYAHDFFKWALGDLIPAAPPLLPRILLFIPFAALFLVSVSSYVAVELGTSPYDAAPIIIHRKLTAGGRQVSSVAVRIAWDLLFTLVGLALGGPAGAVTAACVVFLGPLIQRISALMKRLLG
ncbi:MAG: hypothetical protein IKH77_04150 [Clostridia bacterium]|nr:hypothetical protein [Clostridia bacterium]